MRLADAPRRARSWSPSSSPTAADRTPVSAASPSTRRRRTRRPDGALIALRPAHSVLRLGPRMTASLPRWAPTCVAPKTSASTRGEIDHLLQTPPRTPARGWSRSPCWRRSPGSRARSSSAPWCSCSRYATPSYFAKEWATLDLLSGGRSILGVGVGWHEDEFHLMGVPHKERGRRMDEMLEAVTALWAGDDVTIAASTTASSTSPSIPSPCRSHTRRSGSGAALSPPRRSMARP